MKFKSQVFTQTSGSIGGQTFSHNRGGMYTRARATPVDPGTIRQSVVRIHMSTLSNRWVNILSTAQRAAWDLYSDNVQLPDRLGEPRNVGGIGMYVRSNLPRRQAGLLTVDDAPIIFDLGDFTLITAPDATDAPALVFDFTAADDWANEDGASMLVYGGRPVNGSINYYKGPWRFAGQVPGDAITPPISPASIPSPFPLTIGQRVFFRVQVTRADGRYSTTQRTFAAVTAAITSPPAATRSRGHSRAQPEPSAKRNGK